MPIKTKQVGKLGYLDAIQNKDEVREEATEEIGDINLGVQERHEIDLTLVKDLNNVKVSINKADHLYRYEERFKQENIKGKDPYDMEPSVRYDPKSQYGSMSYTRALYPSDVYYDNRVNTNKDEQLKIKVTYQIGVKNTGKVTAIINEINDFYDIKYYEERSVKVGTILDSYGEIATNSQLEKEVQKANNNPYGGQYHKLHIKNMKMTVEPEHTSVIYVQVEVQQEKIKEIVEANKNQGSEKVKLDNIAEIASYSLKDGNGNAYAGIDQDSQPGNVNPSNIKTYEDDTDKAPGLELALQENRKIDGIVFKDDIVENNGFKTNELNTGKIRQANGKYENEKGIAGVTVRLVDAEVEVKDQALAEPVKIWKQPDPNKPEGVWEKAEITTNQNDGTYQFEGFIPKNYKVIYIWGDKTYKVQEYKSTIVDKASYEAKSKNLEWYKDEFKKNYPNIEWNLDRQGQEIRVSDAIDNYMAREVIDGQTTIMTNRNKLGINTYTKDVVLDEVTPRNLITSLDANTPDFRVNVEYSTTPTNVKDEYVLEDGKIKMNGIYVVKKDEYKNYLKSIDFGIADRSKQALKLEKQVKGAKITLANGIVLSHVKIENGRLKEDVKHAVYIPKDNQNNGQIKFEVDSEFLQGAVLEIEYEIKVRNVSELDYRTQDYYRYGRGYGQEASKIIELDPKMVIDYLDNNASVDEGKNPIGHIVEKDNDKKQLISNGLLQDTEAMKQQLLEKINRVFIIEDGYPENKLAQKLKPEGTPNAQTQSTTKLVTYKLLTSTIVEEGIELDNFAEIIKVEKTGGAPIITIPGNETPYATINTSTDLNLPPDGNPSETITIVPPTGLSINYVAYTLLAISSLGILITGIILIKKYVLK